MEDSQDEIQILNQRKIQKNLFDTQENNEVQDFTILNNRHEDSIIQGDENSKEYDKGIECRNESNQLKNIYYNSMSANNLIHQISEKEEQKYDSDKDTNLKDETIQIQNDTIQIDEIKCKQLQEIVLNNEKSLGINDQILQIDQKNRIQAKCFQNKDNCQIKNMTQPQQNKVEINNSSIDGNFQILMRAKNKINSYISQYTYFGLSQNLKNVVARQLINDLSDFYEESALYSFNSFKISFQITLQRIVSKLKLANLKVFSLQDNYILIFKILTTTISYLYLFFLSVILLFNLRYSDFSQSLADNYIAVQWIFEIVLKLNCAFSEDTKFIEDRSEIFYIYMKKYFLFDIIPIFFTNIHFQDTYSWRFYLLKSFIFLKIYTTECDLKEIQKQLVIISRKHYIIQIINLILNLFFVGHIIACLWYIVGIIDSQYLDDVNSWVVTTYEFTEGKWWKVYIAAFYWAFTLMATGSNISISVTEQYFTSIVMPFTTIIFGYMINMIGIILSEIDQQEELKRKDINIINRYMERKNISKDLQTRVNLDLEYFYQKNFKKIQEDEEGVLSKISEQLFKSLQYEYNMNVFKKMKNLSNNFSFDSLTELCYIAQEITFSPNQTIFTENQTSDSCLMYIISGSDFIKSTIEDCINTF